MKKLFPFVLALFVFTGCANNVPVEDEANTETKVEQVAEEVQEEPKGYEEDFFYVEPPEDFTLVEMGRKYNDDHDDYAEFESPDGTVSFAVYSPLWYGKGAPIMPNEEVESETEREEKTSVMAESEIGPNANRIDTYITTVAHDKSYWRSIVDTIYEKNGSKTQRAFSFKYKDQESYDKYLEDYKKFKESLVQSSDGRVDHLLEDLPKEISDKGYTHLAETQINDSQTYKYEMYTDKGECDSGYFDDNVPIHCFLIVTDLSDESVVLELESDNRASFELNDEVFAPPTGWYDDGNLLIEWRFGDGGIGVSEGRALNILTGKFKNLYKSSSDASIGNLITLGDKQLLFHYPHYRVGGDESKIVVYEILEPMNEVWDMYADDDQTEIDFAKGKMINELFGGGWVGYSINEGIVAYLEDSSDKSVPSYSYDIEKNEFIPYEI